MKNNIDFTKNLDFIDDWEFLTGISQTEIEKNNRINHLKNEQNTNRNKQQ